MEGKQRCGYNNQDKDNKSNESVNNKSENLRNTNVFFIGNQQKVLTVMSSTLHNLYIWLNLGNDLCVFFPFSSLQYLICHYFKKKSWNQVIKYSRDEVPTRLMVISIRAILLAMTSDIRGHTSVIESSVKFLCEEKEYFG